MSDAPLKTPTEFQPVIREGPWPVPHLRALPPGGPGPLGSRAGGAVLTWLGVGGGVQLGLSWGLQRRRPHRGDEGRQVCLIQSSLCDWQKTRSQMANEP